MRLIDAEQYRREFLNSRDFEPMKILDFQPTVQAIPLAKVKKAKEEIENINPVYSTIGDRIPVLKNCDDIKAEVLEILDKLIEESEE